jgi:hypothetical protein
MLTAIVAAGLICVTRLEILYCTASPQLTFLTVIISALAPPLAEKSSRVFAAAGSRRPGAPGGL